MAEMTTHDEEKLLAATKRAGDLVESGGLSPDAAIEKVAREAKFGPGEIEMLCYAHNTGRQLAQFNKAASVLDKLAEFPLADPAKVIAAVYPAEKAAADRPAPAARHLDYMLPPSWLDAAAAPGLEKAALDLPPTPKADPPPPDPKDVMRKRYGDFERVKLAHEQARQDALRAEEAVLWQVAGLTDYFQEPGRLPFAVVEKVAGHAFGPAAVTLLTAVHQRLKSREKRAADTPDTIIRQHVRLTDRPFTAIQAAMAAGRELVEKRAAVEQTGAAFAAAKEGVTGPFAAGRAGTAAPARPTSAEKTAMGLLGWGSEVGAIAAGDILAHKATHAEPGDAEAAHMFDDTDAEIAQVRRAAAGRQKQAVLNSPAFGAFLGNSVGRIVGDGPKSKNELIEDEWLDLEDPKHQNEMRKIKAHAMLNGLLTDPDSPISGHDPDEVLSAYNEISSLAPRVAEQPAAIRPILARRLQGNVQPFEAKEVTDIEKGIAATRASTPNTSLLKDAPDSLLG